MTFPASDAQARASANFPGTIGSGPSGAEPTVTYTEGIDVGYRWYEAMGQTPLFPFGYGLSYTTFGYSGLRVAPAGGGRAGSDGPGGRGAVVHVRVTNTGHRAGADVVELYIGMPASAGEPPRQLKGFAKVDLAPGASTEVSFTLGPAALSVWDGGSGRWVLRPGTYRAMVGDSSSDIRADAAPGRDDGGPSGAADHYEKHRACQRELAELQEDFPGFRIWREVTGNTPGWSPSAGAAGPGRTPWSPRIWPSCVRC
jgi:hypothetical protein